MPCFLIIADSSEDVIVDIMTMEAGEIRDVESTQQLV